MNSLAYFLFNRVTRRDTEPRKKVCTWLREICFCSCLTVLPGPAWVLLSKTNKPLFSPLYNFFFRQLLEYLQWCFFVYWTKFPTSTANEKSRCVSYAKTNPLKRPNTTAELIERKGGDGEHTRDPNHALPRARGSRRRICFPRLCSGRNGQATCCR